LRLRIAEKIKPIPPSLYLALVDRTIDFDRQIEELRQKIANEQKQLEILELSRRETIAEMIRDAGFKY
jgi:cell division protein FtsL